MSESHASSDHLPLKDIQGNLAGFNKDHQRLLFANFTDAATGKAFLAAVEPYIATASEVRLFNQLYKEIRDRKGEVRGEVESTWVNLALSSAGLQQLGVDLSAFPEDFREGMAARAGLIGDVGASAPATWLAPFTGDDRVHLLLVIASDTPEDLEGGTSWIRALMAQHSVIEVGVQDGHVRDEPHRGREHFGFKDGISQPYIHDLSTGQPRQGSGTIAAGEFVIGHSDQDGHISGQPKPPVVPDQPGYNPTPPAPPGPLPHWATNGSFLVYRRLRQNVAAFQAFTQSQADPLALPAGGVGAKLVGRWPSGAPLEAVQGEHQERDPAAGDPGVDPASPLLNDAKINHFDYARDTDGHLVPRAAHIRKANPRDSDPQGGLTDADKHRLLRRGIPYGPEFQPAEPAYPGSGPVPDNQDRGLIFICYQSSLTDGFEFVQQAWANTPTFPQPGDGRDPIISQDVDPREAAIPPRGSIQMAQWVTTTGGDYFFSPAPSVLRTLARN